MDKNSKLLHVIPSSPEVQAFVPLVVLFYIHRHLAGLRIKLYNDDVVLNLALQRELCEAQKQFYNNSTWFRSNHVVLD